MNWSNAQKYCRENCTDLATVRNPIEDQKIQSLMLENWSWIGLFRSPSSFWSDGSHCSFRNWEEAPNPIVSNSIIGLCGVAALQESGKWNFLHCGSSLPFVCYSVPPAPGE